MVYILMNYYLVSALWLEGNCMAIFPVSRVARIKQGLLKRRARQQVNKTYDVFRSNSLVLSYYLS